jgi:THAP domain
MAEFNVNSSAVGRFRYSCKYPNCSNRYYSPVTAANYVNKVFHRCPTDSKTLNIWKDICKLPTDFNVRFYICQDHFEISDCICGTNSKYLIPKSVPKAVVENELISTCQLSNQSLPKTVVESTCQLSNQSVPKASVVENELSSTCQLSNHHIVSNTSSDSQVPFLYGDMANSKSVRYI